MLNQGINHPFVQRRNKHTSASMTIPIQSHRSPRFPMNCLRIAQYCPSSKFKSLALIIDLSICTLMRPICCSDFVRTSRILLLLMTTASYGATHEYLKACSNCNSNPSCYCFLLALHRRFPNQKSRRPVENPEPRISLVGRKVRRRRFQALKGALDRSRVLAFDTEQRRTEGRRGDGKDDEKDMQ